MEEPMLETRMGERLDPKCTKKTVKFGGFYLGIWNDF